MDTSAFREFEHEGWQKLPARYHEAFGGLTTQAIEPLLDAVGAKRGTRLLDIASGPGYVAAAAAARGADVIGMDFAASMVAEARRRYPHVTFQEGDAEELPFAHASFDAVTMSFGLMHLGRPERAIGEAHRVLRSGGRFGFTVWANPEQALGFAIVFAAIQKHGNVNAPIPPGPPFFRFSDGAESRRVLADAGFSNVEVRTVHQAWRLGSRTALWDFMTRSTVRTAALLQAQTPQALEAIRAEVVATSQAELPMPAVLAHARKD